MHDTGEYALKSREPPKLLPRLPYAPVGGKLMFRAIRVVGIVDDKLPQVMITVEIKLGEFHCQASPLRPDHCSLCINDYGMFHPTENNRHLTGGLCRRDGLGSRQADTAHADVDPLL